MTSVLGISCSGRKSGFTATLLKTLIEATKTVEDIEAEIIYPTDYNFGPCISCFGCIRDPEHSCSLNDDFGKKGEGLLFKKVKETNALIIASPVHDFGMSSIAHTVLERLYPFVWSGHLIGMPFVGIVCASCGGGHFEAIKELCRQAYVHGMRWIDGLPVHVCNYSKALTKAKVIGVNLAYAAKKDNKGRKGFTDVERMLYYQSLPWKPLNVMLKNFEMIPQSVKNDVFKRKEAIELVKNADLEYGKAIYYYNLMKYEEAIMYLNRAWSYWARASWSEYLERKVIGVKMPDNYRLLKDKNP